MHKRVYVINAAKLYTEKGCRWYVLCRVYLNKKPVPGASLVVQRLRLRASSAGRPGAIPGQGARPRVPPLKSQCVWGTWNSAGALRQPGRGRSGAEWG